MTNLAKLQDAYAKLGWAQDNIKHEGKVDKILIDEIKRLIHEFMVDNEPTPKKGTFNIWDWTCDDDLRPVMNGIFHDKENKMAVATNAHLLVADADYYDESRVDPVGFGMGKSKHDRPINKYGEFIDGRFPNWKAVVPPKDGYVKFKVDQKQLDDYIKKCNAYLKMNGLSKSRTYGIYEIKISNEQSVFFEMNNLKLFLTATDGIIYVKEPNRAAMSWSDTRTALIMPMLRPDKNDVLQSAKELGLIITRR